jgi:hypothetical protein
VVPASTALSASKPRKAVARVPTLVPPEVGRTLFAGGARVNTVARLLSELVKRGRLQPQRRSRTRATRTLSACRNRCAGRSWPPAARVAAQPVASRPLKRMRNKLSRCAAQPGSSPSACSRFQAFRSAALLRSASRVCATAAREPAPPRTQSLCAII